jgi:hypothetical protein
MLLFTYPRQAYRANGGRKGDRFSIIVTGTLRKYRVINGERMRYKISFVDPFTSKPAEVVRCTSKAFFLLDETNTGGIPNFEGFVDRKKREKKKQREDDAVNIPMEAIPDGNAFRGERFEVAFARVLAAPAPAGIEPAIKAATDFTRARLQPQAVTLRDLLPPEDPIERLMAYATSDIEKQTDLLPGTLSKWGSPKKAKLITYDTINKEDRIYIAGE